MELTRYEKETVINWNQAEEQASLFTHDAALIRKMDNLCEKSTAVTCEKRGDGWAEYNLPKGYIRVNAPRQLSEETKAALAERMRNLRKN